MNRHSVLLIALLLGACKAPGTYVELSLMGPIPTIADKLVLNLVLGQRPAQSVTVPELPAQFPSTMVLEIVNGEGDLDITGQLQTSSGTALSTAPKQTVTVVRGKTISTTLVFPVFNESPNPDLRGPDLMTAVPDLTSPPDLTAVPVGITLTKVLLGNATGTVKMNSMICQPTCFDQVLPGTMVTLEVTPDADLGFEGWPPGVGGNCVGTTSPCTTTITTAGTVDARIAPFNRVFFSSATYFGDRQKNGNPGPQVDFDTECRTLAAAASLPSADKYVAFYSTASRVASEQLKTPDGAESRGWVRMDKLPFSDSVTDLKSRRIFYPVLLNDLAQNAYDLIADGKVSYWTGTNSQNELGPNCNNWSDGSSTFNGVRGSPIAGGNAWTDRGQSAPCNTSLPILCMGTAFRSIVLPPKETGRQVFVSSVITNPAGGLAPFDQACWSDAMAAGLCVTADAACKFKAAVTDDDSSIADRLAFEVTKYVRLDGALVANDQNELFSNRWATPIAVTAVGSYTLQADVLTGVPSGGNGTTAGTAANTCTNWSTASSGFFARTGNNFFTNSESLVNRVIECSTIPTATGVDHPVRVYCVGTP